MFDKFNKKKLLPSSNEFNGKTKDAQNNTIFRPRAQRIAQLSSRYPLL